MKDWADRNWVAITVFLAWLVGTSWVDRFRHTDLTETELFLRLPRAFVLWDFWA